MEKIEIDLSICQNLKDEAIISKSKDLIEPSVMKVAIVNSVMPHTKPVSNEKLKEIVAQLGLIHTNFPENQTPEFEGRKVFPSSYNTLNPKERLLLLFAENFRRQFNELYPERFPLVLAVANECGVQVCNIFFIELYL